MNSKTYCVLMAGGLGSSFWPITNKQTPKQFLDLLGTGKTFIRQAYERVIQRFKHENIFVVTNNEYASYVYEQIPELSSSNLILEPLARNTASTIAYAAFKIRNINKEALIAFLPAAHYITNDNAYLNDIEKGISFAEITGGLITIGIKPTRAETNYGYIQMKDSANSTEEVYKVKTFTEKPNRELATTFYESKEFLWNSNIIMCKVNDVISELEEHMPMIYNLFTQNPLLDSENESSFIASIYENIHNISFSTGVMERSSKVYVLQSTFGWSSLSSWKAFFSKSEKDDNSNVDSNGNSYFGDAHNCIVKTSKEKAVVIQGLDNIIVAENDKYILVCNRQDEHKISGFEKLFRIK